VANGVVYLTLGVDKASLYAFDAKSGERKLQLTVGATNYSVTVADGFVYVGSSDHKLHAFSLPQGGS
jgi:outer membrane protein assembly factor BamB